MKEHSEAIGTQSDTLAVDVQRSPINKSVVHVSGELLRDSTQAMQRIVTDELLRAPAQLALDLSEVTNIDAIGIAVLVSVATQAGESDISFCLVGVRGRPVGKALAAAELTELFEIFPTVSDT
jgi:anti-sigma B factor antagonist